MLGDLDLATILLRLPVVLFALTIHEFMHAWVALKCGDDTAWRAGRVTLNPLRHLDLFGTICLLVGPIGWAKPVPVNRANLRHGRRDDILVSGAGIAANLAVGIVLGLGLRAVRTFAAPLDPEGLGMVLVEITFLGLLVNLGLAVFNLLPIPPLDGSHILENLLPPGMALGYAKLRPYGIVILLAVVFLNRQSGFLWVPLEWMIRFLTGVDAF